MNTGRKAALRRGMAVLLLAAAASVTAGGRAAAQVYSIALPDITSKRLSARPETVQAGGTVEIRNAVWNLGAAALTAQHAAGREGPALTIGFVLVRNLKDRRGLAAGSWGLDTLERREVAWHTAVWTVPETTAPGDYFLCAEVDPQNTLRESNELNNRACLPFTVTPAPAAAARETPEHVPPEEPGPDQPGEREGEPEDGEDEDTGETEEPPEEPDEPGFSGPSDSPGEPGTR